MKQKHIKVALITFAIFISGVLAIHFILLLLLGPPWQGIRQMERDFSRNQESIFIARDYLIYHEHDSLRYPASSGNIDAIQVVEVGVRGAYVSIKDEDARNAMNLLLRNGYEMIVRNGNFIIFLRWSNMDNGRGIVYSTDGTLPDELILPFLTKLEPMSVDGWFYYEENFNEFRILNQN